MTNTHNAPAEGSTVYAWHGDWIKATVLDVYPGPAYYLDVEGFGRDEYDPEDVAVLVDGVMEGLA